jgi:carbamoyl-phosphate synthase large subunit
MINKVSVGRPHVVDAIMNKEVQLVINTGSGGATKRDGYEIRRAAIKYKIPYATTIAGAMAMYKGIAALKKDMLSVKAIQEYNS